MKLVCTFLALLVLLLSAQPACMAAFQENSGAGVCCSGHSDLESSQTTSDDDDDCSKSCNPFQICNCCVCGAVIPQPPHLPCAQSFNDAQEHLEGLIPALPQDMNRGFWQPPRSV